MQDIFIAKDRKKGEVQPESLEKKDSQVRKKAQVVHPKTHAEKEKLPGHTHNPLAAFCYYPDKINFVNKDPEEEVILLLRRHPLTNLGWILLALLMLSAPSLFSVFPFFAALPVRFQIVAVMVWYLLTLAFIIEEFLSWFFNVNIVTDERIFDVDFVNLVYREMTDANIDQIQDVTVQLGSAVRTIFNYGNLLIQTAAEIPQIEFEAVPQPDKVARILRELRIEEEVEKLEGRVR